MKLDTKNFGTIEVNDNEIINFPDGLPGFENEKKFIIINNPDDEIPFKWLQSVDNTDLAFVIINPFLFKTDYEFTIPDHIIERLKIKEEKDIVVYSIVVVPEDMTLMTANLLGPIIINSGEKLGKQIILDDNKYKTKHYILEEAKAKGKEE